MYKMQIIAVVVNIMNHQHLLDKGDSLFIKLEVGLNNIGNIILFLVSLIFPILGFIKTIASFPIPTNLTMSFRDILYIHSLFLSHHDSKMKLIQNFDL